MGNYIVEEDIKDYSFPKKETPKKDNKNLVIIISIGVFVSVRSSTFIFNEIIINIVVIIVIII